MAGDTAPGTDEMKERALQFAEGLASAGQADGFDLTARLARSEPEGITLAFDGTDARYLVGKGGQALDALQYIASLAIVRRGSARLHITFDADSYRLRRENTLKQMAQQVADQVVSTGQEAVLDPMTGLERRIVHQALQEVAGIRTYSEGEEPERYLVIAPAE